jgi:hypothetical protein
VAVVGDTIIKPPGEAPPPPKAPAGTHWAFTQQIFSDTGGATVWTLVADSSIEDLQSTFTAGLTNLLSSLIQPGSGSGSTVLPAGRRTQTLVFNFTSSGQSLAFTPDQEYWLTSIGNTSSGLVGYNKTLFPSGVTAVQYYPEIIWLMSASQAPITGLHIFLPKDQKIYVNSGGGGVIQLVVEAVNQA